MIGSAYWICPDAKILNIGFDTHIAYIIKHPATFNTTKEKITELYSKFNEIMPTEALARKSIIMDLLNQHYIRIRKYKNHWSISLIILDDDTKSRLSKWASNLPNTEKYSDVIIQTYGGKKHHYSVQDLYSQSF